MVENGIDASRLEAEGYGESKPMATNKTKAGRAENRRVEFKVLK
jgi:outer membrane protein OmpA-like peptidoglycan-associated protein